MSESFRDGVSLQEASSGDTKAVGGILNGSFQEYREGTVRPRVETAVSLPRFPSTFRHPGVCQPGRTLPAMSSDAEWVGRFQEALGPECCLYSGDGAQLLLWRLPKWGGQVVSREVKQSRRAVIRSGTNW